MRIPLLAAVLSLALVATAGHAGAPKFRAPFTGSFASRYSVQGCTADFDGDGKPDVATLDIQYYTPYHVSVLYGLGDGTFGAPETLLTAGYGDYAVAAGDLDGDGLADLVTSGSDVAVFLSQAGRTFGPRTSLGPGGSACLVADVTGDGKADVVASSSSAYLYFWGRSVDVYPGDGAGGFGAPVPVAMSGDMFGLVAADVDGDGKLDLVSMYQDTLGVVGIGVRRNLGGGSFAALQFSPIDAALYYGDARVADFDGDGVPDAVCGSGYAHGLGNGTFGASTVWGASWSAEMLADFDGDGHLDIAGTTHPSGYTSGLIKILRGHGDGTVTPYLDLPAQFDIRWADTADFDLDGRPDIVACSYNQYQAAVYLQTAARDFGASSHYATGAGPYAVVLADVTGDGLCDVVVADYGAGALRVLPGIGGGRLGAPTDRATPAGVVAVAVGDVNGDGVRDLVCGNGNSNGISVFLGTGGGAFGPRTDYPLSSACTHVALGDLDGDGRDDVAATGATGLLSVWLGSPSGALGARTDYALYTPGLNLAVARVNADAYPDVIVGAGRSVSTFPGNGTGSLGTRVDATFATGPSAGSGGIATFGDVNGDGALDAVIATDGSLYVRIGNGSGGFAALAAQAGGRRNSTIAIGDLDEDGKADLVMPNYFGNFVTILTGDGTGVFTRTNAAPGANSFTVDAQLADMDGDGHLDIVTADEEANTVTVILNRTPGLAAVPPSPAPGTGALAFARVGPLPARGALSVNFTLPARGRAALELLDVSGRRVQRVELGELGAGGHTAEFARDERVRPGVYWLRLGQGSGRTSAKVVFVD